jgi:hypothetical protein
MRCCSSGGHACRLGAVHGGALTRRLVAVDVISGIPQPLRGHFRRRWREAWASRGLLARDITQRDGDGAVSLTPEQRAVVRDVIRDELQDRLGNRIADR